jgi:hypothetical protein
MIILDKSEERVSSQRKEMLKDVQKTVQKWGTKHEDTANE